MRLFKPTLIFISALALMGCLETQTAPELDSVSSTEFKVDIITSDLKHAWAVVELPDQSFLITERSGKLYHVKNNIKVEIKGLPEDIIAEGQGGLLDIVLSPSFAETSEIFLSYAYGTLESNGTALFKASLENDSLTKGKVVFRASPPKSAPQHFGGRIVFLPDETLILTLGDGFAFREDAQKPGTHIGKIVRLTQNGRTPQDNPFLGQSEFKPQIYSLGHRNVQGVAYDLETNTLWAHEHGPRGGDELNSIRAGENYGWPIATKGTDYQGARISPFETYEGMVDPIHNWTPSIAPSGLVIYRGNMFPQWNGDALVGALKSRDLRRVDIEKGQSVNEVDLISDLNARIRDVRIANDGAILILTDDPQKGQLIRLSAK